MVSCFPGVEHGRLYYRHLEIEKSIALSKSGWNFEAHMTLSDKAKQDIKWWTDNALGKKRQISHGAIKREIKTVHPTKGGVPSLRVFPLVAGGLLIRLSFVLMDLNFWLCP
jgi:hypothetical protein